MSRFLRMMFGSEPLSELAPELATKDKYKDKDISQMDRQGITWMVKYREPIERLQQKLNGPKPYISSDDRILLAHFVKLYQWYIFTDVVDIRRLFLEREQIRTQRNAPTPAQLQDWKTYVDAVYSKEAVDAYRPENDMERAALMINHDGDVWLEYFNELCAMGVTNCGVKYYYGAKTRNDGGPIIVLCGSADRDTFFEAAKAKWGFECPEKYFSYN